MSTKKHKPPLALDMEFGEAMQRFARADMPDVKTGAGKKIKPKKRKKPT